MVDCLEDLRRQGQRRREALSNYGCATYTLGQQGTLPLILCLCCGVASVNQSHVSTRYCGFCHQFHQEEATVDQVALPPLALTSQQLGVIQDRVIERKRYAYYRETQGAQDIADIEAVLGEVIRLRQLIDGLKNQAPFPAGMVELPMLGGHR